MSRVCEQSYCRAVAWSRTVCEQSYCRAVAWPRTVCEQSYCRAVAWPRTVCEQSYCRAVAWSSLSLHPHPLFFLCGSKDVIIVQSVKKRVLSRASGCALGRSLRVLGLSSVLQRRCRADIFVDRENIFAAVFAEVSGRTSAWLVEVFGRTSPGCLYWRCWAEHLRGVCSGGAGQNISFWRCRLRHLRWRCRSRHVRVERWT